MKTLIFHGSLRTLCPENLTVEASSVAEAVSSLKHHPAFKVGLNRQVQVSIDGFSSYDAIYDRTDVEEIHIRPAMVGSGRGNLQIIIGIVLIVATILFPPAGAAGYALMGVNIAQSSVVLLGASMILGGVLQMLAPQPTLTGQNDEKSRYLSGAKNTVAIGTRIPILYGTRKVYGHYISFDIDAGFLNSSPDAWYSTTFTDYSELTSGTAPPVTPWLPVDPAAPKSVFQRIYQIVADGGLQ